MYARIRFLNSPFPKRKKNKAFSTMKTRILTIFAAIVLNVINDVRPKKNGNIKSGADYLRT